MACARDTFLSRKVTSERSLDAIAITIPPAIEKRIPIACHTLQRWASVRDARPQVSLREWPRAPLEQNEETEERPAKSETRRSTREISRCGPRSERAEKAPINLRARTNNDKAHYYKHVSLRVWRANHRNGSAPSGEAWPFSSFSFYFLSFSHFLTFVPSSRLTSLRLATTRCTAATRR